MLRIKHIASRDMPLVMSDWTFDLFSPIDYVNVMMTR